MSTTFFVIIKETKIKYKGRSERKMKNK